MRSLFQRKTMLKLGFLLFSLFLGFQTAKFCLRETELTDDQFYDFVERDYFQFSPYKVISTECPDPHDNSTCLYIIDRIGFNPDGSWFAGRFVAPAPNLEKGFLSVSKLSKPVFKSKSAIDTATWRVDVGTLDPSTPNGVEFASLFTTGHFPTNQKITGNVQFIGVATGALMSFISHHFKNLNLVGVDIDPHSEYIAKKWFGYVAKSNSKILIDDGAEHIRRMAEAGETSDAVLVDACHNNSPPDGFYCPVEPIRTPEFLENLSKVIGAKGITAFNVFSTHGNKKTYGQLRDFFLKFFAKCRLIRSDKSVSNVFLVCSNADFGGAGVNRAEVLQFLGKLRLEKFMHYVV